MATFDLLGRTWMMGVIWQLGKGAATFRDLRARCADVSPTLLNTRLKELRATGLVESTDAGYALTELGESLYAQLIAMREWSDHWAASLGVAYDYDENV